MPSLNFLKTIKSLRIILNTFNDRYIALRDEIAVSYTINLYVTYMDIVISKRLHKFDNGRLVNLPYGKIRVRMGPNFKSLSLKKPRAAKWLIIV